MAHETSIKFGVITGTLKATGTVQFSNFAAGFLKTDSSGNVLLDTNTYLTTASAAASYQPLSTLLTNVSALSGTSGFLKKTGANTLTLDTATYVDTAGTYTNPSWLVSIPFSKLTGTGTTLAFYGITDTYTSAQVDSLLTGLSWKNSVRVATTANITLSGTQTIDGVSVIAGDRVLVKNQTTTSANGIYVVAAGTWARSSDTNTASTLDSATVFVEYGTLGANTQWTETATVTTINTSAVAFAQISGAGTYTANTGVTLTGNVFSAQTQMSITADSSGIKLVNDSATPGNSYYYGTNGSGTKGFYAFVGLTDSNKGDITVASSGSSWTINNSAVTYAKIQNVSATQRLLGRSTAGAGVIEELSLSAAFSLSSGTLSLDGDLEAIAAIATTGFLKRTGTNTWTTDSSTYLTAEVDTLNSVTTRGATTGNGITVGSLVSSGSLTVGASAATFNSKTQALGSGTTVVFSIAKTTFKGLFIDYSVYNGTNQRSGSLVVTTDGTGVDFTEMTTNDIGNTGSIDCEAVVNGSNIDFRFILLPDATYTSRVIYRYV